MSAAAVADFAIKLMQGLPGLVQAGVDIAAHIGQGTAMLNAMKNEDRGPTQAEYEALRALNQQAHDEFQRLGTADPQGDAQGGASSG